MRILLVEPFFSGSHQSWALGFQKHSSHEVEIFSLPGRHWKWRMHGAAITLSHRCESHPSVPDLILVSDMLDAATFRTLIPKAWKEIPLVVYFHENQLTYPWSDTDPDLRNSRNRHYAWINFSSALAADAVLFNSQYHLNSFLDGLSEFLQAFPDHRPLERIGEIKQKASVLYLGLDLSGLGERITQKKVEIPTLLWNHRWEYDKNPEQFFSTLTNLKAKGIKFKLIVCGENYGKYPAIFDEAKEKLTKEIIHWGFAQSRQEYSELLKQAHLLPVCNKQDFFGISIAEALWMGVKALLPNRLTYPELFGNQVFYETEKEFETLLELLINETSHSNLTFENEGISNFDWNQCMNEYDAKLQNILNRSK